jgi:mRNA-degrading endonuclease toxin of MazEF toxin-antitoxin module
MSSARDARVRVVVLSSAILNEHAKSAAAPVRSSCGRRLRRRRLTKGIYSGYPRLYLVRWREIVSPPWKGDPRLVDVIFDRQQSAYVCVEVSNDAITEQVEAVAKQKLRVRIGQKITRGFSKWK